MSGSLSQQQIESIESIFRLYDEENNGFVSIDQAISVLNKLGRPDYVVEEIGQYLDSQREERNDCIDFDSFIELLASVDPSSSSNPMAMMQQSSSSSSSLDTEQVDPKVIEFLRILEEYRAKCEEEGNYLEAERSQRQIETLRTQEEKRQRKAVKARQLSERHEVQVAHNQQMDEFNASWAKYLEEYDLMAQNYIQQMTERHAANLLAFQQELREEVGEKPPRWSRELLDWRRRQHMLAKQHNYVEAQRVKKVADQMEQKEREAMEENQALAFARRESQFRKQQQAELKALLMRIESRRKEHLKTNEEDCKKLLQRNRNVQAVLESKQNLEAQKTFEEIHNTLYLSSSSSTPLVTSSTRHTSPDAKSRRKKRKGKKKKEEK
jgi:hypothetical protein